MKKLLFCLTALLCWAMGSLALAAPGGELPRVAILYVDVANTTYDAEIDQSVMGSLTKVIDGKQYVYVDGAPYIAKLNKMGITDMTTAERADIVSAFEGEDVDYVVYVEVQPFVRKERMTLFTYGIDMTAVVPVKVIDLAGNKYIYNGKFTEKQSDSVIVGGIGNKSVALEAIDKVNKKITAILVERLPKTKQAPKAQN